MRLPSCGGPWLGGTVSRSPQFSSNSFPNSPAQPRNSSNADGRHFSDTGEAPQLTALSLEFVAKPEAPPTVQVALPSAIHSAFATVTGFAGGFVFIANDEARLVTVVTLWTGRDRARLCEENLRWVRALVTPYLDRCLRVQTLSVVPSNPHSRSKGPDAPVALECLQETELQEDAVYAA